MHRPIYVAMHGLLVSAAALLISGCGTSSGSGTKPQPDFSLSASASTLTLTAGGSAQAVSLTATALNGFSATIQATASGLPSGVTATPLTVSLTPGSPQSISFAAAASAASTTATVQITATSASLSHTASVSLTVQPQIVVTSGIDVTTYHFDVGRTGLNPAETSLTPSNVTSSKFGLLRVLGVDGKVDAQRLVLSGLTAGGSSRNAVFVATEHDTVYAFDADTGVQIWKTSILGANETTSGDHGCGQISPEIGITSTPVIDRHAGPNGTIFVVGMSIDGGGAYHQRLHALDVTTGAELDRSPSEIRATYPGTGANSSGGNVVFDPGAVCRARGPAADERHNLSGMDLALRSGCVHRLADGLQRIDAGANQRAQPHAERQRRLYLDGRRRPRRRLRAAISISSMPTAPSTPRSTQTAFQRSTTTATDS